MFISRRPLRGGSCAPCRFTRHPVGVLKSGTIRCRDGNGKIHSVSSRISHPSFLSGASQVPKWVTTEMEAIANSAIDVTKEKLSNHRRTCRILWLNSGRDGFTCRTNMIVGIRRSSIPRRLVVHLCIANDTSISNNRPAAATNPSRRNKCNREA